MKTIHAKKFLACLMAVLLLLTSLSLCLVSAETEGDFEYAIWTSYDEDFNESDYVEITKYNGNAKELTIPAEIEGLPVECISYGAFMNCTTLTSVTVPDSVTRVDDWAFYGCENLSTVNLPDTLTSVGGEILNETAYSNNEANWENGLLYSGKYLLDADYELEGAVEVKEGTELIAGLTFCYTGITSVKLPESLRVIDDMAFSDCMALTSVTLPKNLEEMGNFAFGYCESLTEITIPASVKTLGSNAFASCPALKSVVLSEGIEVIPSGFASYCTSLKSITLPSTVKEIGYFAFEKSGIEKMNISANVEDIASEAFSQCENLTEITVDSANENYFSVDGILYKKSASGYTDKLHTYPAGKAGDTYTLPEDIEYIDSYAFAGTVNLKKVVLHANTPDGRYFHAQSIEYVDVNDANEYIYDVDGVVFKKADNTLFYYPAGRQNESYTTPAGTAILNTYAFYYNENLTELTISEGAETMKYSAICMCENLKTVNLPSTLTSFDADAIDDCYSLTAINFAGTMEEWNALEAEISSESDEGLYVYCTDGKIEVVAPDEDYEDPTEDTEPTAPTEPESSAPAESTATNPTESAPADTEYELGDANMDKKLNIRDATLIQKHLAKIVTLEGTALELADFTQDGKLNIKDATNIQKKIAGII